MKDRIYAFLIHLAISSVIAAIAIIFVFYIWYPMPLHEAVGVTEIFLMVLAVDITIGPILTFVVFKRGKSSLPFDLTVIAMLQLAALGYGMYTVFDGRPAFVVFNTDRFDVTRASDVDPASAKKAEQEGNEHGIVGWLSPRWVAAVKSPDIKRRKEIMFASVQGGADWPQLPELFVPLSEIKPLILKNAKPVQKLYDLYSGKEDKLNVLDKWKDKRDVKWLALRGTVKDMVVLIDAGSAEVVEVIDIEPWP